MSFSPALHSKEPVTQSRHLQTGALLLLVALPGCILPAVLSLSGLLPADAPFYSALTTVSLGLCLLLALRGPWWVCLLGGVLSMAGALLVRLPALFLLPDGIFVYEIGCFALYPFLLLGTARLWRWLTGRQGLSYLLSVIVLLMAQVGFSYGWYAIINYMYSWSYNLPSVLPSPFHLLWSFVLYCGVYLLFSMALFRGEAGKSQPSSEGLLTDSEG